MKVKLEIEEMPTREEDGATVISLPPLSDDQREEIDPLVPPTSGIRLNVMEKSEPEEFIITKACQGMFLRILKAVSIECEKRLGRKMRVLIVSDDRPSCDWLTDIATKVFAFDGHYIIHQSGPEGTSRLSTPYASAAIALNSDIDVVVVLTASHNAIIWNGVKFYFQRPIPISGDLMKDVSRTALELHEVPLANAFEVEKRDLNAQNNDYIAQLVDKILPIERLHDANIVFWPMMGESQELIDLFERYGAHLHVIQREMDPPDPTHITHEEKEDVEHFMQETGAKTAVLVDADRDRVVVVVQREDEFVELNPNELYTAIHNVLAEQFGLKIVNVRTVPSDPRGDGTALLNFITGVGYKHLGVILYLLAGMDIDPSQVTTGVLYVEQSGKLVQLTDEQGVQGAIRALVDKGTLAIGDTMIMVLWEESGGHTFNILTLNDVTDEGITVSSQLPLVGDKYPAVATLLLCELVERGIDLFAQIDRSIISTRTVIDANDQEKVTIMGNFKSLVGKSVKIGGVDYKVASFKDNEGEVEVISLSRGKTTIYFRPSGTGPNIRIYVFGPQETAEEELTKVTNEINTKFR
ncbi:MAG TPA: hypothetical protein VKK79_12170 [Candidatus Lokiarchaeia archaeon]|nr:hypothetical protein [Candidatus Lokiarchaeia archaeon]